MLQLQLEWSQINKNNDRQRMMTTSLTGFQCLQINLQHCATASTLLAQIVLELNIDIIFVQAPYTVIPRKSTVLLTSKLTGYRAYHALSTHHAYRAIIIYKSSLMVKPLGQVSTSNFVGIEIICNNSRFQCFSIYQRSSINNN